MEIAVADERVVIEAQSCHLVDVTERFVGQSMQLVIVQKQTLQRRQVSKCARLNVPQTVVLQIQLLEPWQLRERARFDVLDAISVQIKRS